VSFHPNDVARRTRVARLLLLVAFVLSAAASTAPRCCRHASYVVQSEENRLREVPLPAPAGIIYDRNGKVIAENLPGYTVSIYATSVDSLRATLRRLNNIIPYTDDDVEAIVQRFNRAPNRPAVILADAKFQEISVLEEHRTEFPQLIIQSTPKRWYPDGPAVASLVGYTGEISELELATPKYEAYKAGMRVGKRGLEQQYEGYLRGREGYRFVEVDARGRVVREAGARADQQPQSGPDLQTNVDLDLQKFVVNLFADTILGAAVALDPRTGGVLALHSAPTYDPNRFTGGIQKSYWDSLNTDPRRPMYNKAVQGRYPPASTFKLATALLAMQDSVLHTRLDERQPVPCTGGYWYGRYWRCWDKRGHGDVNLRQAIEKSVRRLLLPARAQAGADQADRRRREPRLRRAQRHRPAERDEAEFPYALEYYKKRYPRGFVPASSALNLSIGQGENAQTVVNMAKFYTALATDGTMSTPSVVRATPQRERIFTLTDGDMAGIRRALTGVVSERGTAGSARLEGVTIAGKTGTAQNPPNPDHAWFVGFAPAEDPQVVVAVFLEYGEHGYFAARVASKIIEAYLKRPATASASVQEGE
jgi:penicillin-binding protein 2